MRVVLSRHLLYLLGVLLSALYTVWPLLRLQPWGGHDANDYPPRYVEYVHLLAGGQFPPRWASDFSFGYGEPFFSFNPPLIYLLNAAFQALGASAIAAENLEAIALALLAAIAMYALAQEFFGPRGGLVAAAAYLSAPYFLVTLYVRHSMPDFAAFAFLPLCFWGLYRFGLAWDRRFLLVGALGVALLTLSSNPIALVAMPFLALSALALTVAQRSVCVLLRAAAALALGLALAAFFWLPAYVERALVHTERLIAPGYLSYWNHFVYLWQLEMSPWGYGDSVAGPDDGMSFSIGAVHVALVLVAATIAVSLVRRSLAARYHRPVAWPLATGLALVVGGAAMTAFLSRPLWDRLPTLQYLQFPWRFLELAAFGAALLAPLSLAFLANDTPAARRRTAVASAALVLALAWDSWGHAQPDPTWQPQPGLLRLTPAQIAKNGIPVDLEGEFEPRWLTVEPSAPPPRLVAIVQGTASVQVTGQLPGPLTLRVVAQTAARLRLNIHYFPGWTITEHGQPVPIAVTSPDDLMTLAAPAGAHQYIIAFRDTPIRRLANTMSVLALLLLIGLLARTTGRGVPFVRSQHEESGMAL